MSKIKFIHTADIHLDSPFKGIENLHPWLGDKLKQANSKSFSAIIDLCIKEKVDFLLIVGDIFDHENKSLAAQIKFVNELKRLTEKGIHAFFVTGNHDPLSRWIENIPLPDKAHRFGSEQVEKIIFNKDNKPAAAIYGISFQNDKEVENLAKKFNLDNAPSPISIALLHGTTGFPGKHGNYAPFKVEDVLNKGFDYWALGHIHKRHIVRESFPAIVYPGNPQGRDFGETGTKGCFIVEIEAEKTPVIKYHPIQSIRFEALTITLSDNEYITNLPELIEKSISEIENHDEKYNYILKVILTGRTPLHNKLAKPGELNLLINSLNENAEAQIPFTYIDNIQLDTRPEVDIEQLEKSNDFVAELLKMYSKHYEDNKELHTLIDHIKNDFKNYQALKEIDELSEKDILETLDNSKWILIDELLNNEG